MLFPIKSKLLSFFDKKSNFFAFNRLLFEMICCIMIIGRELAKNPRIVTQISRRYVMDKIQLLQERKALLMEAGKEIRGRINAIVDENSFVETSAFSFSQNEFYEQDVAGEGVITGFATINDYPFYIVAQNFKVLDGGVSKANCDKIAKCLDAAEKNSTPVVYILNTRGVQVGEGV